MHQECELGKQLFSKGWQNVQRSKVKCRSCCQSFSCAVNLRFWRVYVYSGRGKQGHFCSSQEQFNSGKHQFKVICVCHQSCYLQSCSVARRPVGKC